MICIFAKNLIICDMKTISVQVSDDEYSTFGLTKERFLFSEFAGLIERQRSNVIDNQIKKFQQITENLHKINDEEPLSAEFDEILAQRIHFKEIF